MKKRNVKGVLCAWLVRLGVRSVRVNLVEKVRTGFPEDDML